jgi:hypothetical protein
VEPVTTSWGFLLLMLIGGGGVGFPLGVPPLPEDPALARIAPEQCLLYFSSSGMATPDGKSTNQTEKLFAEPELQRLAAGVETMIRTQLKESARKGKPQEQALAEAGPTLVKALLTRPLAVYVSEVKAAPKGAPQFRGGAILSLGDHGDEIKAAFDKLFFAVVGGGGKVPVNVGGTAFDRLPTPGGGPEFLLGAKGNYYYIATGEGEMEALLKRAEGSAPRWLTELRKQQPVERVSTVAMINIHALAEALAPLGGPDSARVLEATGISGIDRLTGVSGLDKDGFVSRSLVSFRGEPKGLLQLADQKPLTTADLELIPRDATFALAWKLDPAKARATIQATANQIDPKGKEPLGKLPELYDGLFKALGDTWCVFDSRDGGGMFTGVTAVVSLKDRDAAEAVQKRFLASIEAAGKAAPDERRRPRVEEFEFAGKTVHVFESGDKSFPLAPSWCLTDKHLVVAVFPESIKAFLSRGKTFQSLLSTPEAEVKAALEGDGQLVSLAYVDSRRVFDMVYPLAPWFFHSMATEMRAEGVDLPAGLLPSAGSVRRHLRPSVSTMRRTPAGVEMVSHQTLPGNMGLTNIPVAVGLLVPAVQKVRDAAARVKSSNNLKQLALGMHQYLDTNRTFPPAYSVNKDGKPLLSWRVAILPYIDQMALYKEFHLDEPWDSPHNKKLLEKMPATYRSPKSAAEPGMTNYLTVRGKDTMFPGEKGVGVADVTDGLSNTIMIVEVSDKKAVPWTRPDDFEFNEKNPADGLLGLWAQGFLAAMGDGSVRFITGTIDAKVLKDLFLRNDGNPIPPDY